MISSHLFAGNSLQCKNHSNHTSTYQLFPASICSGPISASLSAFSYHMSSKNVGKSPWTELFYDADFEHQAEDLRSPPLPILPPPVPKPTASGVEVREFLIQFLLSQDWKSNLEEAQEKAKKIAADGKALYEFSKKDFTDQIGIAGEAMYRALQASEYGYVSELSQILSVWFWIMNIELVNTPKPRRQTPLRIKALGRIFGAFAQRSSKHNENYRSALSSQGFLVAFYTTK